MVRGIDGHFVDNIDNESPGEGEAIDIVYLHVLHKPTETRDVLHGLTLEFLK